MNREVGMMVQALIGFAVICFVVLMAFYALFFFLTRQKEGGKKQKKPNAFLGIINGFSPLDVFSLSLLTIRQFYYIWCMTQTETTIVFLAVLIVLGFTYNIMNRRFVNIIVDAANSCLLYVALLAKNIFYMYIVDVAATWHVVLFLGLLVTFSLIYAWYFYLRDIKNIADANVKRLHIENTKNK